MHIELTEMLRCPEPHRQEHLVLSTAEMLARSVRSGTIGCPVCRREFRIARGVADFGGSGEPAPAAAAAPGLDPQVLQALLDLSGPGGLVVLVGRAAGAAAGLAAQMGGIHFVGVNAPAEVEELPALSLVVAPARIPLRDASVRGVVVGADAARAPWIDEATRVLLRGRRLVIQAERAEPAGVTRRAVGDGLWVGEKA
jgi:uncharacterized protein YbaR (Trm112 family)